ncbi:MAG: uL22 family ribosomal protein [Patescibacteria group bacterium]
MTTVKTKITAPKVVASPVFKESIFIDKNLQISPRKLRLLVNTIKKLSVLSVLPRLQLTNTKAARILTKSLKTAVATAKNNYKLSPDTLSFVSFKVDEGPKTKRMDKSHGSRFARGIITRRHSRLTIVLRGQTK